MKPPPSETQRISDLVWPLVVGVTGCALVATLIGVWSVVGWRGFQYKPEAWCLQLLFFGTPYFVCAASSWLALRTRFFQTIREIGRWLILSALPTALVAGIMVGCYVVTGKAFDDAYDNLLATLITLFLQYPLAVVSVVLGLMGIWTRARATLRPDHPVT